MSNFIRQLRAYEGETVEIAWTCQDGSVFHQRVTIPPKATRDTVAGERNAVGQIVDRLHENASGQRV